MYEAEPPAFQDDDPTFLTNMDAEAGGNLTLAAKNTRTPIRIVSPGHMRNGDINFNIISVHSTGERDHSEFWQEYERLRDASQPHYGKGKFLGVASA